MITCPLDIVDFHRFSGQIHWSWGNQAIWWIFSRHIDQWNAFTPPKTNMTLKYQPFKDVFPIKHRDFPWFPIAMLVFGSVSWGKQYLIFVWSHQCHSFSFMSYELFTKSRGESKVSDICSCWCQRGQLTPGLVEKNSEHFKPSIFDIDIKTVWFQTQ